MTAPIIVWFRHDLRLHDNQALDWVITLAEKHQAPIIPIVLLDNRPHQDWPMGGAIRWWLHHALVDFNQQLEQAGNRLWVIPYSTDITHLWSTLIETTRPQAVVWARGYEPAMRQDDADVLALLKSTGVDGYQTPGSVLFEPQTIENKSGNPFQVFTAFWRHCLSLPVSLRPIIPAPDNIPATALPEAFIALSASHDKWNVLPTIPWDDGFYATWTPTREGALKRLDQFLAGAITSYPTQRDVPSVDGTSTMSPYLHFGQISPHEIWHATRKRFPDAIEVSGKRGFEVFLREIGWREFAMHLLYHFDHTPLNPLRADFDAFPWEANPEALKRWQQGLTGYPIVDAGMRQLWHTGWMHNRVRMIVASFLVKDLRIHWVEGAHWFWDTLVDADLASNTLGWQWTAGCGADAAPYFRVFNPTLQGEKFDPEGAYVRRWVPELAGLPNKVIHQPWNALPLDLHQAGVVLGETYPEPIVDHKIAKDKALAAFAMVKKSREQTVSSN